MRAILILASPSSHGPVLAWQASFLILRSRLPVNQKPALARRVMLVAAVCLALSAALVPGLALAQGSTPTQDQYTPIIHQHQGGGGAGGEGLSGRVGPL